MEPAWVDDDGANITIDLDEGVRLRKLKRTVSENKIDAINYENRLRDQFLKINGKQSWADLEKKESSESDESGDENDLVFQSVREVSMKKPKIIKLFDVNAQNRVKSVVGNLEFHPSQNLISCSGRHHILQLFDITNKEGIEKLSLKLSDFSIECSHFIKKGNEIVCSSNTPHLYVHDIVKDSGSYVQKIRGRKESGWPKFCVSPDGELLAFVGDSGTIVLVSSKSMQWVANLRVASPIKDASFISNNQLYSVGDEGDIYLWDIKERKCLNKFSAFESVKGTCISCSNDGRYLACGTESGIVPLYNMRSVNDSSTLVPKKEFFNLLTPISFVKFSPYSQLLCFGSFHKKNSVRMVDLGDMSVYKSWPCSNINSNIGNISCADFSSDNKFLAIGNSFGRVILYRIQQ